MFFNYIYKLTVWSEIEFAPVFVYITILLLTLTKKCDDVDISPFIESRKTKKELKKAEKLNEHADEQHLTSTIPDGYWRCLGCGEILPDDINECECGYRK